MSGKDDIDKLRMEEQLLLLREELDRREREVRDLERRLAQVEAENRRFTEQYVQAEQENNNLANLYVASYRLHGTLDREEVLAAIKEIVANLIGSEEIAIFELDPGGAELSLVTSIGLDPDRWRRVPLGEGIIGRVAQGGEPFVALRERDPSGLTACVPLKLDDRITGVVAIFGLLTQKSALEAVDHELLSLLATHAATALYCTALHARVAATTGSAA